MFRPLIGKYVLWQGPEVAESLCGLHRRCVCRRRVWRAVYTDGGVYGNFVDLGAALAGASVLRICVKWPWDSLGYIGKARQEVEQM